MDCVIIMRLLLLSFFFLPFVANATCPPGACPPSQSCCLMKGGEWGCCPYEDAVCCDDGVHCCPNTMRCDLERSMCVGTDSQRLVALLTRRRSKVDKTSFEEVNYKNSVVGEDEEYDEGDQESDEIAVNWISDDVICPDKRSKCPVDTTCCVSEAGGYGCCPLPEAVCCSDRLHCCPSGSKCDMSKKACIGANNGLSISWQKKFPSTPIRRKPAVEVHHPHSVSNQKELPAELKPVACGHKQSCPAMTTCCTYEYKGYTRNMCCPLQNAVCCEQTCCPSGYRCHPGGKCEKHALRYNELLSNK